MFKAHKTRFALQWFVAVSTCIYLGIRLSGPLGDFLHTHYYGVPYFGSTDGFSEGVWALLLLFALFMGLGQWLVINTRIKRAYGWILATVIGFCTGSVVSFWVLASLSTIVYSLRYDYEWIRMIGGIAGASILTGVCQWISLKRNPVHSIKWSLVMAFGIVVGSGLVLFVGPLLTKAGSLLFSIAFGLITGLFAESLIIGPEDRQQEIIL